LTHQQDEAFTQMVSRRVEGVPIAYLTGEREFYSLTFRVTEAVLIPRPETELLVDLALARIPQNKYCRVLDLGTGSGAIALVIAKHRPKSQVIAIDFSAAAVSVANLNVQHLGVKNVQVKQGNWFDELSAEKFDLIVSNPPYVAEHDAHLQKGDLRFEPLLALSSGDDGLACIKHIVTNAHKYLADKAWILLEHGYDQATACKELLADSGYRELCAHQDLAGIVRVSGGRL